MSNQIARTNMIKQQLRTGGVLDESILSLYTSIPRESFVPAAFQVFAYSDMQIPLANGQRMLTPLEEGLLLQALQLQGRELVLEVGTGSGFFTALLSRLAKKVISIDYYAELSNTARHHLQELQCDNVELITGDAHQGWLEAAPFDAIVFTGGLEAINDTHRLQVLPGGQLVALVGTEPVMQAQLHTLDHQGQWHAKLLFETNIPLLINKDRGHNNFLF